MRTDTVPVVDEFGNRSSLFMSFKCALQALSTGKIEQIFDNTGKFLGVMLRESKAVVNEFHRPSLRTSKTTITCGESRANVGIGPARHIQRARRKVRAWPDSHDDRAVVISAGMIHHATIVPSLPA